MIDGRAFSLAFAAGLVATVNPCGFAMLPAYLSFFLGLEGDDDPDRSVLRGAAVGTALTAGFVAVFAAIGLVIVHVNDAVMDAIPYATIAIGLVTTTTGTPAPTTGLARPSSARPPVRHATPCRCRGSRDPVVRRPPRG